MSLQDKTIAGAMTAGDFKDEWQKKYQELTVEFSGKVPDKPTALATQVGGDHYKHFKIQPVEFCHINNIGPIESACIWYLCRWRQKGGFQDLEKTKHFIDILIELEKKKENA